MKALLIALIMALFLGAQVPPRTTAGGVPAPSLYQADGPQGDTCG